MPNEILVKGFVADGIDKYTEILYAVYPSGTIMTTGVIPASGTFNPDGRKWHETKKLPKSEFMGNYYMPVT